MFLFWRLLLSHILGDFPLQTDTIYYLKVRVRFGTVIHGLIFIVLNILLAWPYLGDRLILAFLITIGLSHSLIDWIKINFKSRYSQGETIITFLSDQLVHIAIISLIIPLRLPAPVVLSQEGLASLYYSDKFIFYAIAFSFVSFGGFIFSTALKNSFAKSIVSVDMIPQLQRYYGMAERTAITFLVMAQFNFWPIALAILPRLIPPFKKKAGGWSEAIINYVLSLVIGLLLRRV